DVVAGFPREVRRGRAAGDLQEIAVGQEFVEVVLPLRRNPPLVGDVQEQVAPQRRRRLVGRRQRPVVEVLPRAEEGQGRQRGRRRAGAGLAGEEEGGGLLRQLVLGRRERLEGPADQERHEAALLADEQFEEVAGERRAELGPLVGADAGGQL